MKFVQVFAIAILCLCLACGDYDPPGDPLNESELPGKYWANYDVGTEYIELFDDSTYVHYYKSKDGKEFIKKRTWKFVLEEGGYFTVMLEDFVTRYPRIGPIYDPLGTVDSSSRWYMPYVEKRHGKLRIKRHPTYNQYYIKE